MMRLPFFVVALLATVSNALPNGAPLQSCTTLIPNHPTTNTDDSFGQFVIETELRDTGFEFEADESYNSTYSDVNLLCPVHCRYFIM